MSKSSKDDKNFSFEDFDTQVQTMETFGDNIGNLDLSEVPEKQKYVALAPGVYDAVIDSVELGNSMRSGNPMLTWTFKVKLPDGRDRTLFYHTVLKDSGLSRLKRIIVRLSPYLNNGPIDLSNFSPAQAGLYFTGVPCRVRLRTQPYNGELRNSVSDVMAPEGIETFE
jgi:hypothetical protein